MSTLNVPPASDSPYYSDRVDDDRQSANRISEEDERKKAVSVYRGVPVSVGHPADQNTSSPRRSATLRALLRSSQARRKNRPGAAGSNEEELDDDLSPGNKRRSIVLRCNTQRVQERHHDSQQRGGDDQQRGESQGHGEQPAMASLSGRSDMPSHERGALTTPLTDQLAASTGSAVEREYMIRKQAISVLLSLRQLATQDDTQRLRPAIQALMIDLDSARAQGAFGEAGLAEIVSRLKFVSRSAGAVPADANASTVVRQVNLLLPLVLLNAERPVASSQREQRRARLKMIQAF